MALVLIASTLTRLVGKALLKEPSMHMCKSCTHVSLGVRSRLIDWTHIFLKWISTNTLRKWGRLRVGGTLQHFFDRDLPRDFFFCYPELVGTTCNLHLRNVMNDFR